ncbi:HXXXD-type acyl-transferase family protein [Forsythia ovata]|uniref:HXXXD-type acyl-transferase family protein n=1 Tax=Forsythia ovata TaxID=205694 RepID=A0ABD1T7I7_9LAMI
MSAASINLYYRLNECNRRVNNLEKSLAQILPQFYPFARRYKKEDQLVDSSNQGVEFVEVQVDCKLVDIIGLEDLNDLLLLEVGAADEVIDPITSLQINKFKCGGIAIATSISHRIADAASLNTFLYALAKASQEELLGILAETGNKISFQEPRQKKMILPKDLWPKIGIARGVATGFFGG